MLEKINNNNFPKEILKDFQDIEEELIDILFKNNLNSIVEIDELLNFLEKSKELKDKKFSKVSYLSPHIIFETISDSGKKEIFMYNLQTERFEEKVMENLVEIPKKLEKGNLLLSAMENIFQENEKELVDEIGDEDKLKTDEFDKNGLKLKGKTLREMQLILRENIKELDSLQGTFNEKEKKEFIKQQKKYLEFFMGVGDDYEGGANYLLETRKNFEKIAENIVKNQSLTEVFLYMAELHQKIDLNNYQSTNVETSYKMLIQYLNSIIFERLKNENASDQDFITFSKIITGRGDYKNGEFEDKDIDDNLRNPLLASESLVYVFQKKGGMFEKMGLKSLDDKLIGKTVGNKIAQFGDELKKAGIIKEIKDLKIVLKDLFKFDSLLSVLDKKYDDLNIEEQTKLSILNKIIEKIILKRKLGKSIKGGGNSGNDLITIFSEATNNVILDTKNKIESKFSSGSIFDKSFYNGKKAEDFGLNGIYKEAFDLFIDMNGVGLLNSSDLGVEYSKIGGKIAGVMAVTIVSAILTGGTSLMVQGAIAGGVGSASSWAFMPKGYDSGNEMAIDLGTDLAVGVTTGYAGGGLTQFGINKFGKVGANGIKTMDTKTSSIINGVDIGVLGFGAEIYRVKQIDNLFLNQNLLITEENIDLGEYYKKQLADNKKKNKKDEDIRKKWIGV